MTTLFSTTSNNGVRITTPFALKSLTYALLFATCAALSACGGGSSTPAATVVSPAGLGAKTKTLIGFDVQVTPTKADASAASVPTSFEIKISDANAVTTLVTLIGKDYETAKPVTPVLKSAGVWTVNVPAGTTADNGLLMQMTLKDGDIFETGLTDFPLM